LTRAQLVHLTEVDPCVCLCGAGLYRPFTSNMSAFLSYRGGHKSSGPSARASITPYKPQRGFIRGCVTGIHPVWRVKRFVSDDITVYIQTMSTRDRSWAPKCGVIHIN